MESIERSWLLDFILLGTAVTQSGPHLSWAVGWLGSLCGPLSPGTGNALPRQLLVLSASALSALCTAQETSVQREQ